MVHSVNHAVLTVQHAPAPQLALHASQDNISVEEAVVIAAAIARRAQDQLLNVQAVAKVIKLHLRVLVF